MYLSTSRTVGRPPRDKRGWAVGGNVIAIGAVSLITDISAEMVTAILPLYLVVGLGMSPLAYGAIDGLYTGATALLRLAGGWVADRTSKRKAVAGLGYAVSALAKLGLVAAGGTAALIATAITADRAGKGLRTAPRDALIAASVPDAALGRAFGVHRAMDAAGAFAGPLFALAVLAVAGEFAYDAVFFTSFVIAVFGVVVLGLFVRDRSVRAAPATAVRLRAAAGLLRLSRVRRIVAVVTLLSLATVGDGFVYLLLQRETRIAFGWFPLLAVGTSLVYLLLAAPLGALADRIGRLPVVLGGYCGLACVYLALLGNFGGLGLAVVVLAMYGAYYAATDGVLIALAAPTLPEPLRATGLAMIQTVQALARFGATVLFGLAWQVWNPAVACVAAAVAVFVALVTTAAVLPARGAA